LIAVTTSGNEGQHLFDLPTYYNGVVANDFCSSAEAIAANVCLNNKVDPMNLCTTTNMQLFYTNTKVLVPAICGAPDFCFSNGQDYCDGVTASSIIDLFKVCAGPKEIQEAVSAEF